MPKNGGGKRVCLEQDYSSDREMVNNAKSKCRRELKIAIEEAVADNFQFFKDRQWIYENAESAKPGK